MNFLLEKSLEHIEAASRERTGRNYRAARRHYLESAECLFKAAGQTRGRLRQLRFQKLANLLFMESIRQGTQRDISWQDIQAVLSGMQPSVSGTELEKYARWQADQGGE